MYFVYILYSLKTGQYFIGQTSDLSARVKRHNSGFEEFTRKGCPWELVWQTSKPGRGDAMILEKKLKNLSRSRLIQFIEKYSAGIKTYKKS